MDIPIWAKLAIRVAWSVLRGVLVKAGVPEIAVQAIEIVLQQLGILGGVKLTHDEVRERAEAVHRHCSGVACAPELKG